MQVVIKKRVESTPLTLVREGQVKDWGNTCPQLSNHGWDGTRTNMITEDIKNKLFTSTCRGRYASTTGVNT